MTVQYTRCVLKFGMGNFESMPSPLRKFITGGAGTGKSHVLMAPTGVTIFKVGGLTIDRSFNLPVEQEIRY